MSFFRIRRKKKSVGLEKKDVNTIIQQELAPYMKLEELQEYLRTIERDRKKKELWDSMSMRKKIKLLRYVAERKGVSDAKK